MDSKVKSLPADTSLGFALTGGAIIFWTLARLMQQTAWWALMQFNGNVQKMEMNDVGAL